MSSMSPHSLKQVAITYDVSHTLFNTTIYHLCCAAVGCVTKLSSMVNYERALNKCDVVITEGYVFSDAMSLKWVMTLKILWKQKKMKTLRYELCLITPLVVAFFSSLAFMKLDTKSSENLWRTIFPPHAIVALVGFAFWVKSFEASLKFIFQLLKTFSPKEKSCINYKLFPCSTLCC